MGHVNVNDNVSKEERNEVSCFKERIQVLEMGYRIYLYTRHQIIGSRYIVHNFWNFSLDFDHKSRREIEQIVQLC